MKHSFTALYVVLFSAIAIQAQEIIAAPFVKNGKSWVCQEYQAISPHTGKDHSEAKFFFQGDSLVDGKSYKCLYCRRSYIGGEKQCKLVYLLRQEGDKVYTHTGNILYEFGLNIGETSQNGWQATAVGDTILSDGIKRKYQKMKYTKNTEVHATDIWVEGIGSLKTGIEKERESNKDGSRKTTLQCVAQNGRYIYHTAGNETFQTESMLAENKLWLCGRTNMGTQEVQEKSYFVQGDTTINGIATKKMYLKSDKKDTNADYQAALYEDGDRVYCCFAGQQEFELLYDFGLSVGARVTIQGNNCKVVGKDCITVNGKELRRIHLADNATEGDGLSNNIWVEGFGSLINPLHATIPLPGTYESCLTCEMDGAIVLEAKEMETPLKYPSWVGAVWSYIAYDFEKYSFIRYTVLDEPKSIGEGIYFPLVQYSSCEYAPEKEERRWHIRQEDNFVYMLKSDSPEYGDAMTDESGILLFTKGNDYILYDFNYSEKKQYCMSVESAYAYETISMQGIEEKGSNQVVQIGTDEWWIKGIGSTRSLVHPVTLERPDCVCGTELNFFSTADGKVVYKNTNVDKYTAFKADDCALNPNAIEKLIKQKKSAQIHISNSTLHCTAPDAVKLEVYTMNAVKVGEARFVDGEATVKVGQAPAMYLYIVTYPDGRRESGKARVSEE